MTVTIHDLRAWRRTASASTATRTTSRRRRSSTRQASRSCSWGIHWPTTSSATRRRCRSPWRMLHHTRAVARGSTNAMVVGDMPFLSYQVSVEEGIRKRGRFLKEAGAHAVKLEGPHRADEQAPRVGDPGDGAHRPHAAVRPRDGGYRVGRGEERPGRSWTRHTRSKRRARSRSCSRACRPSRPLIAESAHAGPHDRDRRRAPLRRPGAGRERPAGPQPAPAEAREGVRGPAWPDRWGGPDVRGECRRRHVSGRGPRTTENHPYRRSVWMRAAEGKSDDTRTAGGFRPRPGRRPTGRRAGR